MIIVVRSTPGAGDGGSPAFSRPGPPSFLPTDPATPTPTKPASTPAPVDAPTGVPSTGSSSMTDMRSVKDPSAQSSVQARYCEQVQSYLQGRRAFSRSAAVTLQSLGVAVPRPQALTKIRPALEESPLFHLEQVAREGGAITSLTEADTRFGLLADSSLLWWWCAACMDE